MIDYLLNYGVKRNTIDCQDLDVNDRLQLQDQINNARQNYSKLLELLDDIQGKYIDCSIRLSRKTKELIEQNEGVKNNSLFNCNDEYLALETEIQALKTGISMVNEQIDFYKNDLRILNSVFYNKF